ncbi:MAG: PEP-CTERM sorting domain-containing protein, partial [Candidatus Aminicenantales bacterium]
AGMWPGWWKPKTDQHTGTTGTAGGTGTSAVSVPEPALLALLGVGLVSLGLYAKKKRGKKP